MGGTIALVEDGRSPSPSTSRSRSIVLLVDEETLAKRRAAWKPPVKALSGYAQAVRPACDQRLQRSHLSTTCWRKRCLNHINKEKHNGDKADWLCPRCVLFQEQFDDRDEHRRFERGEGDHQQIVPGGFPFAEMVGLLLPEKQLAAVVQELGVGHLARQAGQLQEPEGIFHQMDVQAGTVLALGEAGSRSGR